MSEKLEEISKTLGMLLENSVHTKDTIDKLTKKIDTHIDKEQNIYEHISKKIKHSENRLRIITDSLDEDIKTNKKECKEECAPAFLEKQMNAIWSLIALILIGSVGYFATHISSDIKDPKAQPSAIIQKKVDIQDEDNN